MLIRALALFASAAVALWVARRVARRPGVGTRHFFWLSVAVAVWCGAGGAHALAETLEAKLFWARVQYLGIGTVAPLWLLFTSDYGGADWFTGGARGRRRTVALWTIPAITIVMAFTNGWHAGIWSSVEMAEHGRAVYAYGRWFWIHAAYNYVLLCAGTVLVARMLRRSPGLRGQSTALLAAAGIPWSANALFLAGVFPPGFDPTPLGFAASGLLFAWALYRNRLFDLVPVARDQVIDSLSDAMVVIDSARRILDMNAAARDLARRKAAAVEERAWIGSDLGRVFPVLQHTPLRTTALVVTSPLLTTAGDPACFDVRVLPVEKRGETAAWVVLLRDVTEQRRAAAEREALQQRVQEQQRRESLSILAGGLAHDFNNLLAGIVGNADLLAMRLPASSSMGTSVGAILLGAQRAADLVSKMLAYAGERHGTTASIDIDAVIREMLDLLRASAARHCTIAYEGQPAVIEADPTQVRQVAMNLIINAADAVSDAGRIAIATGVQTLRRDDLSAMRVVQDADPGDYAFLDVRDNGAGMDEATLARLFQPFFTTKPTGHGLGLAAVQGIVLGHRGALSVESRPGEGSRFCIWFPLARSARSAGPDAVERHDEAAPRMRRAG